MTKRRERDITDYMNHHEGRSVGEAQYYGVLAWRKLTEKINHANMQCEVLERSGLDREAKRLQAIINDYEIKRRQLEDHLNEERRKMTALILLSLAACDVCTTAADMTAAGLHEYSHGYYGKENSFCDDIKEQADSFNKIVQSIDGDGNQRNDALSLFYADMAEEISEAVIPVVKGIIAKYMDTPKGRRYF